MKRTNEKSLGDAIREMLSDYHLDNKLNEVRLIGCWKDVVGEMIDKHTENLYIRKKKLYVKLDSPALKNELMYEKSRILKSLNDEAGLKVIEGLVFI